MSFCLDCKSWHGGYMVRDEVWYQAIPDYDEKKKKLLEQYPGKDDWRRRWVDLCMPCLYRRLGRPFEIGDLEDAPINDGLRFVFRSSSSATSALSSSSATSVWRRLKAFFLQETSP